MSMGNRKRIAVGVILAAAAGLFLAAQKGQQSGSMPLMSRDKKIGSADSEDIWKFEHKQRKLLRVCWADPQQSSASDRKLVRDAVRASWETYSAIDFGGDWPACNPKIDSDIVVFTASRGAGNSEVDPHTDGNGARLRDSINHVRNAVHLNFVWTGCGEKHKGRECVQWVAVHEFGHVLGLTHENVRPDSPETCTAWLAKQNAKPGPTPNLWLGNWDPESVMNYCVFRYNGKWNNNGQLSKGDIDAVRMLYCSKEFPDCRSYSTDADFCTQESDGCGTFPQ